MSQSKYEKVKAKLGNEIEENLKKALKHDNSAEFLRALNANKEFTIQDGYTTSNETRWNSMTHQEEVVTMQTPNSVTLHGPFVSDETVKNIMNSAIKHNKTNILSTLYTHEMGLHKHEFAEFSNMRQTINKSTAELELEFALHTHNTKLAGMILAGSPDYMTNKQLVKRLDAIAPIMNDLAQLEEMYKENPTRELGWAISGMQLNVKQFITGKMSGTDFIKHSEPSAERSMENLQKHSEGWTILKNILFTIGTLGLGPLIKAEFDDNRMLFENTTTSKVRDMKDRLRSLKLENPAPSNEAKKNEEINQELPTPSPTGKFPSS